MAKLPPPEEANGLKAYAKRTRPDGRHYWQIGRWVHRKFKTVKGKSGWYTRDELLAVMLGARIEPEEPTATTGVKTLWQVLMLWLSSQKKRLPEGTNPGSLSVRTYKAWLAQSKRLTALQTVPVARVNRAHLLAVQRQLSTKYAPRTVNQTMNLIPMAWRHGQDLELVPFRKLPMPKKVKVVDVYNHYCPSSEEALQLYQALRPEPRIRLAYLLTWYTGARVEAAVSIHWRDIDLVRKKVRLHRKGSDGQKRVGVIDIHPTLLSAILEYSQGSRTGLLIKESTGRTTTAALYHAMQLACEKAGLPAISPHGLRRLASTELIDRGVSPKTYEALMGHSWEMGMKTYAKAKAQRLESAVGHLGAPEGQVIIGPWSAEG